MSKPISQADYDDSTLYFKLQRRHDPYVLTKPETHQIPGTGWKEAPLTYEFRIPKRAEPEPVRAQHANIQAVLIDGVARLLHVAMKHHREYDTTLSNYSDKKLFHLVSMEMLLRCVHELKNENLKDCLRKKKWNENEKLKKIRNIVYGKATKPGPDSFDPFHKNIALRDDLSILKPCADAYNAMVQKFMNFPSRATIDEIVLDHPKSTYPSRKHNAYGPEYQLLSGPLKGTRLNVHYYIRARDWAKQQGPNMKEIVEEFTSAIWLGNVDVGLRPLVAMDSRFMSGATLKWILDENRGPFVATLNTNWFKQLKPLFTREHSAMYAGSITLYRGKNMLFDDTDEKPSIRSEVNLPIVADLNRKKPSEGAQFQAIEQAAKGASSASKRERKPNANLEDVYDVGDGEEQEDFGDVVEPEATSTGFNASDQYLLLECYKGINESKRERPLYLLSNFVQDWERESKKKEAIICPVYTAFEMVWRACDQVNKLFKEQRMLYLHNGMRRCDEHQLRFDFVLTCVFHLAHALALHERQSNLDWESFGIEAAKTLHQISEAISSDSVSQNNFLCNWFFNLFFIYFLFLKQSLGSKDTNIETFINDTYRQYNKSKNIKFNDEGAPAAPKKKSKKK